MSVFVMLPSRAGRLKKRTKLSSPMNSQSKRVHLVKLKKKAIAVGTMKSTAYTTAAGM